MSEPIQRLAPLGMCNSLRSVIHLITRDETTADALRREDYWGSTQGFKDATEVLKRGDEFHIFIEFENETHAIAAIDRHGDPTSEVSGVVATLVLTAPVEVVELYNVALQLQDTGPSIAEIEEMTKLADDLTPDTIDHLTDRLVRLRMATEADLEAVRERRALQEEIWKEKRAAVARIRGKLGALAESAEGLLAHFRERVRVRREQEAAASSETAEAVAGSGSGASTLATHGLE